MQLCENLRMHFGVVVVVVIVGEREHKQAKVIPAMPTRKENKRFFFFWQRNR
jgi:hypothetical protein